MITPVNLGFQMQQPPSSSSSSASSILQSTQPIQTLVPTTVNIFDAQDIKSNIIGVSPPLSPPPPGAGAATLSILKNSAAVPATAVLQHGSTSQQAQLLPSISLLNSSPAQHNGLKRQFSSIDDSFTTSTNGLFSSLTGRDFSAPPSQGGSVSTEIISPQAKRRVDLTISIPKSQQQVQVKIENEDDGSLHASTSTHHSSNHHGTGSLLVSAAVAHPPLTSASSISAVATAGGGGGEGDPPRSNSVSNFGTITTPMQIQTPTQLPTPTPLVGSSLHDTWPSSYASSQALSPVSATLPSVDDLEGWRTPHSDHD